ncbi:hypothetical protein HK097_002620, partial [Rhizophlyctis rosea]
TAPPTSTSHDQTSTSTSYLSSFLPSAATTLTDAIAAAVSEPLSFLSIKDRSTTTATSPTPSTSAARSVNASSDSSAIRVQPTTSEPTGFVTVTKADSGGVLDPDLEALNKIPRFDPLIKSSLTPGFQWGQLFAAGSKARNDSPFSIDPAPIEAICQRCAAHMRQCAIDVARDQKLLNESMINMDEYCAKLANTVANRCYQAKLQGEQLTALSNMKKQAEKTNALLRGVVSSLEKLDALLSPEDRLTAPENEKKYPMLNKMVVVRREKSHRRNSSLGNFI